MKDKKKLQVEEKENSVCVSVPEVYQNMLEPSSGMLEALSSFENMADSFVPDSVVESLTGTLNMVEMALKPYQDMELFDSGILSVLESATKTPEILQFQSQMEECLRTNKSMVSAIDAYVGGLSYQWNSILGAVDIVQESLAAQNLAVLRLFPYYEKLSLPRGGKRVLKSLTKKAAQSLTQTGTILFDPKEREFYHKDTPEQKVTADEITVVDSSQELFESIGFDELVSFESQLFEDMVFALEHPVGKKIFEIIKGWNKFIDFEDITYYHARSIGAGKAPYIDHDMLKAPVNVSSHGRYNEIGKSCYYIAETKAGAITEIKKHCGGIIPDIQVAGLKPVKNAKIIDLSGEVKGVNCFIEHLRFAVDNEEGKFIKEYLLPNFVASCCKRIGIEGIKYRSTGYNCLVLWRDDYFEFVEGSREIVEAISPSR